MTHIKKVFLVVGLGTPTVPPLLDLSSSKKNLSLGNGLKWIKKK